jgi:hypothetical protein
MDSNSIVRIVCAVLAVVLLGAIIMRRRNRNAED